MPNPKIIEEEPLTLVDVREAVANLEKRDKELSYRAGKAKEYLANFVEMTKEQKDELHKKLVGLDLVRLKDVHITKIIDFLPKTMDDLKILLQGYTVTIPKKEMESIISVVKEVVD